MAQKKQARVPKDPPTLAWYREHYPLLLQSLRKAEKLCSSLERDVKTYESHSRTLTEANLLLGQRIEQLEGEARKEKEELRRQLRSARHMVRVALVFIPWLQQTTRCVMNWNEGEEKS